MPEETKSTSSSSSGSSKNTGMAILCYIGFLFIIPLLTDDKNDPFVKFHIKQGLILFICEVVVSILAGALWFLYFIWWILWVGLFIVWLMGIINAANGKQEPLPLIGKLGEKFKI